MATWTCQACKAMYVDSVKECPCKPRLLALVPSSSHPGVFHSLIVTAGRVTCTCEAGSRGRRCRHMLDTARALADALLAEKKAVRG